MTLWRQPAHALLVLLLTSSLAVLASAAEPAKTPKPGASKAEPAWLRTERAPAKPATASRTSPLRLSLLAMLVVGLGGTALLLRRRRKVIARKVNSELEVLSTARVGAKAEVVVISVAGRKVLLGVTEAQVTQLGWLDYDEPEALAASEALPGFLATTAEPFEAAVPRTRELAISGQQVVAAPPRRFRDALLSALGRKESPEPVDAALTIAEATEDIVTRSDAAPVRSPAGAPAMVDVEGQAKGLVLRLQKRA